MRRSVPAASFFAGLALLVFGSWLVYEPGGFLVAGVALIVVPWLYTRGGLS